MLLELAILLATIGTGAALAVPRLRKAVVWRAIITPLASIIGSGFLVLGPLLNHAFGWFAPLAMILLCAVSWGFGAAIRDNIAAFGDKGVPHGRAETLASALLGFAYIISVAYYLNLLGAFALSLTPLTEPVYGRILATAVYLVILGVGWTRGFALLESMEYGSVALKLSIIAGLLVALGIYLAQTLNAGTVVVAPAQITGWTGITLGFGMIVTVQGFETSRYLGHTYDAETRIRSMRLAQIISAAIYLIYIVFIAYSFQPDAVDLSETAIVDMMGIISPILPVLLVAAALAAQFSAAVADTNGSGGLITELSRNRLKPKQAYAVTVGLGLVITWTADVFQIISYASRAFAAYYAVQAGIAAVRNWPTHKLRAGIFAGFSGLGLMIVMFGTAIE